MATKKPRYTVSVITDNTEYIYDRLTLSQARKTALKEAKRHFNIGVYVLGYNGQCRVYYNQDGNFAPIGRNWRNNGLMIGIDY